MAKSVGRQSAKRNMYHDKNFSIRRYRNVARRRAADFRSTVFRPS
jgi:hypothetical protein